MNLEEALAIEIPPDSSAGRQFYLKRLNKAIPPADLAVLEKLYHKQYPDCSRAKGSLTRIINTYKEKYEAPDKIREFISCLSQSSPR